MTQSDLYIKVRALRQAASDVESSMIDNKESMQAINDQCNVTDLLQNAESALERIIIRRHV